MTDIDKRRKQRRIMAAGFSSDALAAYVPIMDALAADALEQWAGEERVELRMALRLLTVDMANGLLVGLRSLDAATKVCGCVCMFVFEGEGRHRAGDCFWSLPAAAVSGGCFVLDGLQCRTAAGACLVASSQWRGHLWSVRPALWSGCARQPRCV